MMLADRIGGNCGLGISTEWAVKGKSEGMLCKNCPLGPSLACAEPQSSLGELV